MTILLELDADSSAAVAAVVGDDVVAATTASAASILLDTGEHDLVVVGPTADAGTAFELAAVQRSRGSAVGVVLVARRVTSGLLREALVAGVRDVVQQGDLGALAEACQRSRNLSEALQRSAPGGGRPTRAGRLVTVFAAKGGCGKTTLATNIATALATSGHRTCLLDLDLAFGDVAIALQLDPVRTLADALALTSFDETAVRSLVTPHSSGLDAILAPIDPGTAESVPVALVANLLDVLRSMYDHVVVDSPPAFTEHVLAAFDRTEDFVLLTTLDVAALKNLKLTLETLTMLGYPSDRQHIVLNRSDSHVGLSLQDVERALGTKVVLQVPSSRAVPASINRGIPLVLEQPNNPLSLAIRRFALSVLTVAPEQPAARRLFSLRRRHEGVAS